MVQLFGTAMTRPVTENLGAILHCSRQRRRAACKKDAAAVQLISSNSSLQLTILHLDLATACRYRGLTTRGVITIETSTTMLLQMRPSVEGRTQSGASHSQERCRTRAYADVVFGPKSWGAVTVRLNVARPKVPEPQV